MDFTYWYLFPVAIIIASIANGAGIGGATFFSPLFVIALGLEPKIAIGTALVTEVFGFASGVTAHYRARTIDWTVVRLLLLASVPMAVIGSLLGGLAPEQVLKTILGVGLLVIAVSFARHRPHDPEDEAIARGEGVVEPSVERVIVSRDGHEYRYHVCRRTEGRLFAGVGGAFVGLISTGLGELNAYALIKRCRVPSRVTVATSVVVVAVTALAASVTHLVDFASSGGGELDTVVGLAVFTVPGVIIGGQLGGQLSKRVKEVPLIHALGWLFAAVALVTLIEAFS